VRLQRRRGAVDLHRTDAAIEAVDGDTVTLDHPPIAGAEVAADGRWTSACHRSGRPDSPSGDRVRIEFRMQEGDVPQITSIERLHAPRLREANRDRRG
jgi:Cu(I)/Ag(I) efflux system membrane fusion protein